MKTKLDLNQKVTWFWAILAFILIGFIITMFLIDSFSWQSFSPGQSITSTSPTEQKTIMVQGRVTAINTNVISVNGFYSPDINDPEAMTDFDNYLIEVTGQTSIVQVMANTNIDQQVPVDVSKIKEGDQIIAYSDSALKNKRLAADKIQLVVLNFVSGQIKDIEQDQIMLDASFEADSEQVTYIVTINQQTEFVIKDVSDLAAQIETMEDVPTATIEEKAATKNDLEIGQTITVYADQGLTQDSDNILAQKIEIWIYE